MNSYFPSWLRNPFTSSTPPSANTTVPAPTPAAPAAPAPAPGGSSYFPSFGGLFGIKTSTAATGGRHRTYRRRHKSKSKRRRAGRKSTRR